MAWEITFEKDDGEKVIVSLDDLSPDVFEEIAKGTELTFWGVYSYPREHPDVLYKVICAAAEHAGVIAPPRAETMRAAYEQSAMLSETESIADKPVIEGFPQTPGTPESGSTSGVPGDSTGLESSPAESL